MQHDNLVITRAGANSLHPQWLAPGGSRNFDLLVASYDPRVAVRDGDGVLGIHIPGAKVAGWNEIWHTQQPILSRYRHIALIDDDISSDATTISACFDAGARHGLQMWQPSLTWRSHYSHVVTLTNPRFRLRFVNFVEMMCPFFTREALVAVAPLFGLGYESGIDMVWCSLLASPWQKCAVIDETPVTHTRPVGARKAENGFVDRGYEDDIRACLDLFRMRLPTRMAYGAIGRRSGRPLSQTAVALSTLHLLAARARLPNTEFPKMLRDHVRHQFTRRPVFNPAAPAILRELAASRAA